ncbi:hypothetical protein ABEQ76_23920 [Bacillus velezensis]|uniref:hypothetical protein n=1 Tax=Bacillus velezensis TaxID=492670 RepID=UPI0040597D30
MATKLNEQRKIVMIEKLEGLGVNLDCCNNRRLAIYDNPVLMQMPSGVPGEAIACYAVTCISCGNVKFFDTNKFEF